MVTRKIAQTCGFPMHSLLQYVSEYVSDTSKYVPNRGGSLCATPLILMQVDEDCGSSMSSCVFEVSHYRSLLERMIFAVCTQRERELIRTVSQTNPGFQEQYTLDIDLRLCTSINNSLQKEHLNLNSQKKECKFTVHTLPQQKDWTHLG